VPRSDRASPSTRTSVRKGATTKFIAPAYWKFEPLPSSEESCKLSVPHIDGPRPIGWTPNITIAWCCALLLVTTVSSLRGGGLGQLEGVTDDALHASSRQDGHILLGR
jgi:hypothetical protein